MFSKKQKLFINTIIVFIAFSASLAAQYAPGVDWKTIETEHFQIIFPNEILDQAMTVAGKIDLIYEAESMDYGDFRQSKWPLVMTTSSSVANGYVAMAPRRSIWYSTPIAEACSALEWYDLLSLHETRHMVQFDRLNSRFIHLLSLLMGQNGINLGIAFGIPDWFFEGDAVATETLYSESGRGRDPLFYQGMRDVVTNKDYSYQKMLNQSYKDLVPNHYELGYFLTSYVKKTYGEESFDNIFKSATLIPFPSFGMYLGSKKLSGKSWSQLYQDMAEDLKQQWDDQVKSIELIENTAITESEKDLVRWEPLAIEDNSIYARRVSLSDAAVLVKITEEGEQELMRIPGRANISIQDKMAVWVYNRPSLHYDDLNWSDLITMDLETGKKTYLTKKQRYLMPAYNHRGTNIAVIQWGSERKASLLLIDGQSGAELKSYPFDEGLFPANPAWSEDDSHIYFTLQGKEGRAIGELSLDTGIIKPLTEFSMEKMKNVHPRGEYILYSSDFSGLENIMALNIANGEKYQVSSRLNGVAKPLTGSFGGEEILLYSEFAEGSSTNLFKQPLSAENWIPEENISALSYVYYGENNVTRGSADWNLERVTNEAKEYSVDDIEDYSLLKGDFNVHSWELSGSEYSETQLSLKLNSTDVMNTMTWTLGASYNVNEKSPGANLDLVWSQFYPVISMSNEYWYREVKTKDSHDLSSTFSVAFPLNLSRDMWINTVSPSAGVGVDAVVEVENTGDPETDIPVHYGLDWSSYLPGSYRSLNPLFGISQELYFEHNPMQDDDHFFSGISTIYLPGVFSSNSLSLKGAYENERGDYSSKTLFSRGYDEEEKEHLYQFKANYAFPIAYPDAAFGSFFYLKRLRANLFYDYTALYEDWSDQTTYQSVGAELSLDFSALNLKVLPLSMGLRFSWLIEEKEPQVSFILMDIGL